MWSALSENSKSRSSFRWMSQRTSSWNCTSKLLGTELKLPIWLQRRTPSNCNVRSTIAIWVLIFRCSIILLEDRGCKGGRNKGSVANMGEDTMMNFSIGKRNDVNPNQTHNQRDELKQMSGWLVTSQATIEIFDSFKEIPWSLSLGLFYTSLGSCFELSRLLLVCSIHILCQGRKERTRSMPNSGSCSVVLICFACWMHRPSSYCVTVSQACFGRCHLPAHWSH